MSGGSKAQGYAATPGIANISDAVASIIKSGEILVPALQSSGVKLSSDLARSTAPLAGYNEATAGAINMQQQLLGLKPTDFKAAELKETFNQMQQNLVASGQGGNSVLMNSVASIGNNLAKAYGRGDVASKQTAFDEVMNQMTTVQSDVSSGRYSTPNNAYNQAGAYIGNSNVNLGFVGKYNTGKNTGQKNMNENTKPGDFEYIATGNKGGNYSSANGFTAGFSR